MTCLKPTFDDRQGSAVHPLQIIQKDHQRVLGLGHHLHKMLEHQMETIAASRRLQVGEFRLRPQEVLGFRNQINQQFAVGAHGVENSLTPGFDLLVTLRQELPKQTAKGFQHRGIGDIAMPLIALARHKKGAPLGHRRYKFVDDRRLANA